MNKLGSCGLCESEDVVEVVVMVHKGKAAVAAAATVGSRSEKD